MPITILKSLDKACVYLLKQLEMESCQPEKIALKLELDYKLAHMANEETENEFLYYQDNRIVGYLGVIAFGDTAEVTGMVHPNYRRQGIFTKLMRAALEKMHDRQYGEILLLTDEKSLSGKGFIDFFGGVYKNSEYEMTYTSHPLNSRSLLRFEKAEASDLAAIITIDEKCFGKSHRTDIENTFTAHNSESMVGKVRLELINGEGGIFGLGVLPEFRNYGYGKSLLENSIYELINRGAKKVFLQVVTNNENALGLYLNTGFIIENRVDYYKL